MERDNNVVDVHIQVFEGDQFRLGRLEFQGNTTTKDKVLRREIFLEEGDIMDMETFKQSLYKLGQLGYFKVTDNPDFKVNQEKKVVDITVKGNEEGKNDIQFGGGYSEGTGFFVQTQFSTRNFLGEGENLGLSFQTGSRLHFFSLSYADPWFLDTPNSLGVSLFNRTTDYPLSFGYQELSKGGSVAYGYRLHRFDSFSMTYGLEHVKSHYELNVAPDVNGDPAMLRQAFLNLALNACQAMPNGGTLRIRCERYHGHRVSIRFIDTGSGIAPEHLKKIFDLYFTTKEKGSGIGLSMVYRTVQMHDGEIEVQSTPGAGTTFRVLLPQA